MIAISQFRQRIGIFPRSRHVRQKYCISRMVKASRKRLRYTRKQRGGAWWKWWSKYPPGLSANTIKQLEAAEKEAIRKNVTSKRSARNASALIENFNSGRTPVRRPVEVPKNKHEELIKNLGTMVLNIL